MEQYQTKKVNSCLTRRVIGLHQAGYTEDFYVATNGNIRCLQNGECFNLDALQICLVDCDYDLLTNTYKYIHTIDTETGCRGLLVINGILPLSASATVNSNFISLPVILPSTKYSERKIALSI
ncbi:hypothetical protein [Mucilaginibacter pedocola]|uniref:Uncharacterized protein n=1 Tax=Mucilaginibacter pedocola TaxID=1792845 RepID=A0A1S9PFN1_9SPHI|nr:hypothetical protein [Mucilaginibacter pedocola]OOQ59774.1 hypothetical protein BC343_06370 [Mucilaginibacter pedocola]